MKKGASRMSALPSKADMAGKESLQTELQTNYAAQDGIRDYKAASSAQNWRTRTHA
jgi:hypothetical protein